MARKELISVLIVSAAQNTADKLSEMLDPMSFYPITVAKSADEARRILSGDSYDLVIINAPLPSEQGHLLALDIAEDISTRVMLLIKNEHYDEIRYRVEDAGVVTLSKPFTLDMFNSAINIMVALQSTVKKLEDENRKLRDKLEEMRLVNRAKATLIENCAMSEEEAHKYIEKSAMDRRLSRTQIANEILKEYR